MTTPTRTLTGPRGVPLLGVLPSMAQDALGFFERTASEHGGVALLDFGLKKLVLITEPDAIKHVLQDNHRNYVRGRSVDSARLLLGNGLALNNGESWLRQRRLMQPAFHRQRVARFADLIVARAEETAQSWGRAAAGNQPVDVADDMMKLTLRIVVEAMFSEDVRDRLDVLGEAFDVAQHFIYWHGRTPLAPPLRVPTPANRRFLRARRVLDAIVYDLIRERRERPERQRSAEAHDLLDMLLASRDADTGEGMTDTQVRDEVMTIFFAGHETTMTLLTWVWYVLATLPEIESDLLAELRVVLGGRAPSLEDVQRLEYTDRILSETLRLYSPTWMYARESVEDDVVCGYPIARGTSLLISPYVAHRDRRWWPEPTRFDPDRFLPDRSAGRHRFAYLPFGAGPHLCIGRDLALMEARLIVALLAQRFGLERVSDHRPQMMPQVTLRPKGGMPMFVRER